MIWSTSTPTSSSTRFSKPDAPTVTGMFTLLFLPFKLLITFLKLSGVKGALLLAIGVGIGILVAPERGEVMRARLQAKINEARTGVPPIEADLLI